MGTESIAHEAEGRMGYWLRGHEGERNNCFSKIQLAGKKYRDKTTLASTERDSAAIGLVFKAGAILYLWAITYGLVVAQPTRTKNW